MHSMIKKIVAIKLRELRKKSFVKSGAEIGSEKFFVPRLQREKKVSINKRKSHSQDANEKIFQSSPRLNSHSELFRNRFFNYIVKLKELAIIGEIKFASPSAGKLGSRSELLERAKAYEKIGTDAISVITEAHFFKGSVSFIPKVKKEVSLPILQKDFVLDRSQIIEAKKLGSDALLLIARIIDGKTLKYFVDFCLKLGIEPVVEIHDRRDLGKAVKTKTRIIAVNARDLDTFKVNVEKACALMEKIPTGFTRLGFSGIVSKREIEQYKKAGAKGILIGTALMTKKLEDQDLNILKKGEPPFSS